MRALIKKIRQLLKDKRFRRIWYRGVSSTAAIVVFITTYALVLPAITMESEASCGIPAHQHTTDCYEEQLICGQEESDGHHHTDDCYTVTKELTCTIPEHQHDESCFDENGNLTCSQAEHTHDSTCYEEHRELTCGLEESEGHHHDSSCYKQVLTCGLEAHIHSVECYKEDSKAVTASTSIQASDDFDGAVAATAASTSVPADVYDFENASNGSNSSAAGTTSKMTADDADPTDAFETANASTAFDENNPTAELSSAAATTGVLPEPVEQEDLSEGYVPTLDPVNMDQALDKHTGFYYYHAEEGEDLPASSTEITSWKKVDDHTELAPTDLVKAYFAYTIPAGTLNETNQVARYRLPSNLHLTDDQIIAINQQENGIAASYIDYDTLQILDTDNYHKYLGAEAIEGTRTPDQALTEGTQEYISAVVKAENVYDDEGIYGEKGAYLGQDLIFIFTPYTIEKNQNTYDTDGNPTSAGQKVSGWFACDFNMGQIDWVEVETDTDYSSAAGQEKTAEITIAAKDKDDAIIQFLRLKDSDAVSDKLTSEDSKDEQDGFDPDTEVIDEESFSGADADAASTSTEEAESTEDTASDSKSKEAAESSDSSATAATNQTAESSDDNSTAASPAIEATASEDSTDLPENEEKSYDSGTLTAAGNGFTVTLEYKEDAQIPQNATLSVREITKTADAEAYKQYLAQAEVQMAEQVSENLKSTDSVVDAKLSRFFDIKISVKDENGIEREIEPAANVLVNIQLDTDKVADSQGTDNIDSTNSKNNIQKPSVLHFTENGAQEVNSEFSLPAYSTETTNNETASIEKGDSSETDNTSTQGILFITDSFSVYGLVYSTIRTTILTASGDSYDIRLNYDLSAGIPEGSELQVREILDSEEYLSYLNETVSNMGISGDTVKQARFFDIEIIHDGQKIEPLTPVNVSIQYAEPMKNESADSLSIVHFGSSGMENISEFGLTEDQTQVIYQQSSFSVTGTITTTPSSGKEYAVVVQYEGKYYTIDNDGYLTETTYDPANNTVTTGMPMLWNYVTNGSTSYIRHASTARIIDPATQVASEWNYKYIDPASDSGLSEENKDGNGENLTAQCSFSYSDGKILNRTDSSKGIGVTTDSRGRLLLCGNSDSPVQVTFADVSSRLPDVNPNCNTVSHIDISIEGSAEIDVPLAYGSYYYENGGEAFTVSASNQKTLKLKESVPINTDDMKHARITAYRRDSEGNRINIDDAFYITGYSANSETAYSTQQVRIEGSFLVADIHKDDDLSKPRENYNNGINDSEAQSANGNAAYRRRRLENIVYYNVEATKTISFNLVDENGNQLYRIRDGELQPIIIEADVTLSASFNYWDQRNECPPLQMYWQWQDGGIYDWSMNFWTWQNVSQPVSGMDFILGGNAEDAQAHISAVEITKILVDEQGNRIAPDESVTNSFWIYSNKDYDPSVEGLDVGKYTAPYMNYDSYDKVDTRTIPVGTEGLGAIYDYDVPEGMVYIQEDPNSIKKELRGHIGDEAEKTWNYRNTYIQTEYVWRKNGDQGNIHVSDTFKYKDGLTDEAWSNRSDYKSIPEVLGTYTSDDGDTEWNGFLEFYVYNVYDTGKTDVEVTKDWWSTFDDAADNDDISIMIDNQTYTFKKKDIRVEMKLTQYIDGAASGTLQDVDSGITDTIILDGLTDSGEDLKQGELSPWIASWKGLPTKGIGANDGKVYSYKVTEQKVYLVADEDSNLLNTVFVSTTSEDGLTISNRPVAGHTEVKLRKYWDGVNEDEGITIPTTATIDVVLGRYKLIGINDTPANVSFTAPVASNADDVIKIVENPNAKAPEAPTGYADNYKYVDDNWTQTVNNALTISNRKGEDGTNSRIWESTISNLEETDTNGLPYAYYIKAIVEHGLEEGTRPIIELDNNGKTRVFYSGNDKDLVVTNKLPTYKSIEVTKVWKDEDGNVMTGWPKTGEEGAEEDIVVTVELVKNGVATGITKEIKNEEGKKTAVFDRLPKTDSDGNMITYSVREASIAGYSPEISQNGDKFIITNKKVNEGHLRVEKVWRGVPDTTGYPTIYFTLYRVKANGTNLQGGADWREPTDYVNIPLNEDNGWSWTCPVDLPTRGRIKNEECDVGYVAIETPDTGTLGQLTWKCYGYTNSINNNSGSTSQPEQAGITKGDNEKIEGTLYIHNRVGEDGDWTNLRISKEAFYTDDGTGHWTNNISAMSRNIYMGIQVIRRIKYPDNSYSSWADYGDEMIVGYDAGGNSKTYNGNNSFYLEGEGGWVFNIRNQGDGNIHNEKVGLPLKGYYVNDTGESIAVTYEYDFRETGVYQDLNKTPYQNNGENWEWHAEKKGNNIINYRATNLLIEKKWVGKPGATEVYVKVYQKKEGDTTPIDFTEIIATDVNNGNWTGYVSDAELVDTNNKWLILKNDGNHGGSINIQHLPIHEMREDSSSHSLYSYYAVEVGYKDAQGIHWTDYHQNSAGYEIGYLGDLAKFDPLYLKWNGSDWEAITNFSSDPTTKAMVLGQLDTNRILIQNTSRMEMNVRKDWNGFEESEYSNKTITFRIEQTRTPYTDGKVSGNSVKSDLTFVSASDSTQALSQLTIKKTGQKLTLTESGQSNIYKYTLEDVTDGSVPDWTILIDGLQEIYENAAGQEYHCTYKVWEVHAEGATVSYSVESNDGTTLTNKDGSPQRFVTESGQTAVITNTKANAEIIIKKIKQKTDLNDEDEFISGAIFELWRKPDGASDYIEKVKKGELDALDSNGQFKIESAEGYKLENLADGDYQLVEVKAPENYIIINNTPVTFKVEGSKVTQVNDTPINRTGGKITVENGVEFTPSDNESATGDTFVIPNAMGAELPSTGGSGTRWFYILGAALTLFAAGLLWKRKPQ